MILAGHLIDKTLGYEIRDCRFGHSSGLLLQVTPMKLKL